jgi:hypothetical protein
MNASARIAFAICRQEALAEGQRWYHTLPPLGEYHMPIHLPGGTVPGVLVIDPEAQSAISSAFAAACASSDFPGILVDREHSSELPDGDTTSMAWAKELQVRDDGIWTRWDLTAAGEPLITGHAYAYRSPAMALEPLDAVAKAQLAASRPTPSTVHRPPSTDVGRWRPVRLTSIALTNRPHFRDLTPALGRDQYGLDLSSPSHNPNPTETPMDRSIICAKLGLDPAKATDDEILGALDALVKAQADGAAATAACKAATDELATIKARALDEAATAFVLAHKARIKPDQEATVLASYKANPQGTQALFATLADPAAAPATARARIQAGAAATPGDRDPTADKSAARTALIASVAARDNLSRREAICIARREKPELWS